MAVIYDKDNNSFTHVGVPFNYTRGNPVPLDNSFVWATKSAAETYAQSDPTAYVGQLLAVASSSESATLYIIENTAGTLKEVGACKNDYAKLEKLGDYFYYIEFDENYEYDKCLAYFAKVKPTADEGACTSIRKGNLFGRNLDWTYNDKAKFVIRSNKTATRHASIGVAGNTTYLTDAIVNARTYSPYYFVLPFVTTDGINDAGVCVSSHVVPTGDYDTTTGTMPTGADRTLCNYMIPRFILDNFSTAKDAVEYIRDHVNVYCALRTAGGSVTEECAYFIADATETYLIEFINNATRVIHLDGDAVASADKLPTWETNFYRTNKDDPTANIVMQELNTVDYTASKITSHGMGIERWNYVAGEYDAIDNAPAMMLKLKNLWYTSIAYSTKDVSIAALSEFVEGSLTLETIAEDRSAFQTTLNAEVDKFASRSRDPSSEYFGTWETNHSAVYDISKKTMWINSQEWSLDKGLFFSVDDEEAKRDHGHAFVECFDSISSDSEYDAMHMVPAAKTVDSVGYSGYYCEATNKFLYFNNGTWYLADLNSGGYGTGQYTGTKYDRDLIFVNCPGRATVTIVHRSESASETDRIVTNRSNTEEGTLIYKGTCSSGIKEGSENYNVINVTDGGVTTTLKVSDGTLYKGVMILRVGCSGAPIPFWFDGTAWHELGSNLRYNLYNLKAMAYNTNATASYTPEGTVTTEDATVETNTVTDPTFAGTAKKPTGTFTGAEANLSVEGTPEGTVSQPTFTGTPVTPNASFTGSTENISVTGTPEGTVSQPTFSGAELTSTGKLTPSGSVAVDPVTPAGTVSAPALTVELQTSTFKNTVVELNETTGELKITQSADITYATGTVSKAEASAPTFTGTAVTPTAAFTGTEGDVSVKGTPEGTVSQPTFSGSAMTSTGTSTPSGSVAVDDITPAGTVSQPTFTGTKLTSTGKTTPSGTIAMDDYTPEGTNSGTAVTLKAHKHNGSFTGTAAEIISDPYTPEATE